MNLNHNLPGPLLDILERCRKKVNHFRHRDEEGEFQDTAELQKLTQEDLDRSYVTPDYDPEEEADMEMPEDEEEEGSNAKMLKRKTILGAGAAVAVVAVGAVLANTMFSSSGTSAKKQTNTKQVAQVSPNGLPGSYGEISKYEDQKAAKDAKANGQNKAPQGANHGYGTTTKPVTATAAAARPAGTNYKEKYANISSAPAAAPAVRSSAASAPAGSYSSAPAAAPAPSRPSSSAASVSITKESAADKAAQEAAKAEAEAMNSSIAFKTAVQATQAMLKQANTTGTNVPGSAPSADASNASSSDATYLENDAESGSAMCALRAGSVIPATLLTGITSDVPGSDVVAEVRQDVYDSQTGMHLLIPQGSRIIGTSGKAGSRGNARIGVVFTRIILPDGTSIQLPNQNAIDGTGMPGMKDQYTQHSGSIFRSAFMTSILGAAAQAATGNTSGDDDRSPGQEAVSGAVAQVMQAASKLVDRAADQEATITIRPGTAFSLFINQDLMLRDLNE